MLSWANSFFPTSQIRIASDNFFSAVSQPNMLDTAQNPIKKDIEKAHVVVQVYSVSEVERLGRQRPAAFSSAFAELGFCFSIYVSVLMAVSEASHL